MFIALIADLVLGERHHFVTIFRGVLHHHVSELDFHDLLYTKDVDTLIVAHLIVEISIFRRNILVFGHIRSLRDVTRVGSEEDRNICYLLMIF